MEKKELVSWEIKAIFNWADIEEAEKYCEEHNVKMKYDGKKWIMYFTGTKEEIEKIKSLFED